MMVRGETGEDWALGPEHIPTDAYALLRRIANNKKVFLPGGNPDDDAAVGFLLTRKLAETTEDGKHLVITEAGLAVGRLIKAAP